ncbi:MAG: hypothetical protein LBH06_05510, partial [Rikenellaceae bacterium]|nr:hypothetical protein [Rikenellaceae bacterium]
MIREQLTDALKLAAAQCGYEAGSGAGHKLDPLVEGLPAAWIEPPGLVEHRGRRECRDRYKVTLRLLRLPGADDHDAVWAQLEQDAAAICNALPLNDFIFAAEN